MRDGYQRGVLPPQATRRQMDVLAAYVAAGGSVHDAADSWVSSPAPSSGTSPTYERGRD